MIKVKQEFRPEPAPPIACKASENNHYGLRFQLLAPVPPVKGGMQLACLFERPKKQHEKPAQNLPFRRAERGPFGLACAAG